MPTRSYANKVLLIQLRDVDYGADLSRYLNDKELVFYVEFRGLGRPLEFHVIGPDLPLKRAVAYVYNNYNSKLRKVAVTKSVIWEVALDFLNEEYTDHVLTSCTLGKFSEKVRAMHERPPIELSPCCHRHAKALPVTEDTTIGGRYPLIVPYTVETEDVSDDNAYSPSMLNTTNNSTVCFCKM